MLVLIYKWIFATCILDAFSPSLQNFLVAPYRHSSRQPFKIIVLTSICYIIIEMCHNRQDYFNGFEHGYQQNGFLMVETRFLTITFSYKLALYVATFLSTPLFLLQTHLQLIGFILSHVLQDLRLCQNAQIQTLSTQLLAINKNQYLSQIHLICGIDLMFL